MSLQKSVYFTYIVGTIRYRYYCCFKVGIRILIRFMTIFQAKYQCTHEYCVKTVVCVLWGFNEPFLSNLNGKIQHSRLFLRGTLKIFALLGCDLGGIIKS